MGRRRSPKAAAPPESKESGWTPAVELLGSRATFVGALVLAAVVRVANLKAFSDSPLVGRLLLDQEAYDAWARRIAAGDWLGQGVFWVDPLYAYVLAVFYKLFGPSPSLIRALQCALGVATVVLAGSIARRITRQAAVGNAAMLMTALFVPMLHNEVQLEKAALTTFLFAAALAVYLRGTRRALAAAGLLAGLAVLGRSNILLVLPFGVLALLLQRAPGSTGRFRLERESIVRACLFGGGAAAVVGLLTLRNLLVAGELLLTTSIGGPSLYAAQQRGHDSGTYQAPDFVRPATQYEHDDFHAEAVRRVGRPMTDTEVSSYWSAQARAEMLADPGATVARSLRKLRLALHDYEVPDNDALEIAADYSPVLRLPFFWFGQLLPFALLGAFVWWKRSLQARVVAGAAGAYLLGLVIFYVMGRVRLPMTIPVIALAAAGAGWLAEQAHAGQRNRAAAGAAFVAAGLAFCLVSPAWLTQLRTTSLAVSYNNLAAQLLAAGREEAAIATYERAIATSPASVIGAMRTLAELYLKRREYAQAERLTLLVLRHRPNSQPGLAAAVRLYEAMANDPTGGGAEAVRERLEAARRAAGSPGSPRPAATSTLNAAGRTAMIQALRAAPPGSPAWVVGTARDPRAVALAEDLAGAFAQAGWKIDGAGRTETPVKPGVFLFAGEEAPPSYVGTAQKALEAAGLAPSYASGYRAYYQQMLQTPGYRGFPFAPEQTFVVVVGRIP